MRGPRRWRRLASFGGHGGSGWRRLTAPGQWRGLRGEGWRDGAPAGLAAAERLAGQGPGTTLAAVLLTLLLSSAASFIFLANRGGQQEAAAALARHLLGRVALLLAAPAQAQTPDTTAPTLSSATANNTTLRLTYNEALDTNSTPEATAFTVEVDGSDVSLSATNPVAVSGMAVTLTLPNGVGIGKTVKVSYTPGSNPIQDSAGNDAGALIDRSVTVSGICDRTPAVRTRILRKLIFSGITNCANVTSSHLGGITGALDLSRESLTSLQENDFDGLSSLEILYLHNNSLSSLGRDIFDGLTALKELWLRENSLSSLGEDIFNGLSSLERLDLGDNSLSSLHEDIFEGLTLLEELWLNNNSLSSLHEDIFDGLTLLGEVDLRNNSLRTLPAGVLSQSSHPNLQLVQLKNNNDLVCLPKNFAWYALDAQVTRDCYGVSLSVSPTEVSEGSGGESITVTAALKAGNRVKTEATTVTISVEEDTAIEDEDFEAVSDFAITIASGSSSSSGTFTLTARKDAVADDNETVKVTGRTGLSSSSVAGTEVEAAEVSIRNTPPAVELSPTSLTVEEGESGSYTVVLNTQPTGTVTITAGSSDTTVATVMPSSLTFTTTNWNTVQTVRVSSVENDVASEDQTITVSHGISGGGYGSISVADVTITVNDDDTPGVSLSQESLSILEGEGGSYRVVLESEPTGTVTVTASSGDTAVATVTPSSLTFTTTNWNTVQTVRVSSVKDDDVASGDERVSISHTVGGADYGAVTVTDVSVTVNDDDTAGVSISPTSLTLNEGDSEIYTVVLESEPTATVSITPSSDNSDMTLSPGHLTFSSTTWNTPQTITVTALQDDDNEDETVAISHRVRGYGSISSGDMVSVTVRDDDEATGEAVIQAWLPRFGRSVAQQVVERVSRRLQQRPQSGLEVSVAGEQLTNRGPWEEEQGIMAKLLGFEAVSEGQLVEGTEFAFSPSQPLGEAEADGDGESNGVGEGLAFWGAGELSSFNGRQDTISLSATVTTALVAADWQSQRWQAGTALAHSWGRGSYQESSSGAEGQISSNLTGLFPYGRYALNPKLNLWGVVGHGWGRLSLLPQEGDQQSTSIEMSMAAVGLDGLLVDGGDEGLTIRSRADALLLGVSSEQSQQLAGVEGEVSRLRLGLEAQRPFPISQSDAVLTPSLALAIRQDSGDAETGFGLDLAASLLWTDPLKGMEVEVAGRSLLSHGDQSFHEQGLAASFSWDPNPSSSLGPSLWLSQSMGASASSGSDALLNPTSWPEMETSTSTAEGQQRLEVRLGYGLPAFAEHFTLTPQAAVALWEAGREYSLGWRLVRQQQADHSRAQPEVEMSFQVSRRESTTSDPVAPEHSLQLQLNSLF